MHVLRRSNDAESADSTTAGPRERTAPTQFSLRELESSLVELVGGVISVDALAPEREGLPDLKTHKIRTAIQQAGMAR